MNKVLHILLSDKDEGTTRLVDSFLTVRNGLDSVLTIVEIGEMSSRLRHKAFAYRSLCLKNVSTIKILMNLLEIRKYIKEQNPNCILIWNQGYSPFILLACLGYRKAVHVGCKPEPETIKGWIHTYLSFGLGNLFGAKYIFCSNFLKQFTEELLFFKIINSDVIYNAISDRYIKTTSKSKKSSLVKFLMVGALENSKDHQCLLESWAVNRERMLDAELIIVGEGVNKQKYIDFCKKSELSNVFFLGRSSEVKEIMEDCDVFVFACKNGEGFGMVLVESYVCGMNIIAANTPAVRELSQKLAGIHLYECGNSIDLANKIYELYNAILNHGLGRTDVNIQPWMMEGEMVKRYLEFMSE